VTSDTIALPHIPDPGPEAADRPVVSVTTAPSGLEGEGFPVRRAFAGVDLATLDPFVHMDQMGEVDYAPGGPKGTPWHPHRGFETVTYMIDGIFQHQDSNGGGGLITDGDTQWMTAGAGLPISKRLVAAERHRLPRERGAVAYQLLGTPTSMSRRNSMQQPHRRGST
jgi:quercetin 2,3-dioxygenase